MKPLWKEFPNIPWGSIGWRMGAGETYSHNWNNWFKKLSSEEKVKYKNSWPEEKNWVGFYAFIENGTPPPSVIERHKRLLEAAVPPSENEEYIDEPFRLQGLIKHYFKSPVVIIRARDEDFDALFCDHKGFVWGVKYVLGGSPYLKKYSGYLIGEDNQQVQQPIKSS